MCTSLLAFRFKAVDFIVLLCCLLLKPQGGCRSILEQTKKEIGSLKQGVIFLVVYLNPCWTELNHQHEETKRYQPLWFHYCCWFLYLYFIPIFIFIIIVEAVERVGISILDVMWRKIVDGLGEE